MTDYKASLLKQNKIIPKHWYVWYTKPRVEKKLHDRLKAEGVHVFLPLKKDLHQWSDRKKWVEVPLFRGYIFTKITKRRFELVRTTEGVVTNLRFDGEPAIMKDEEITRIKQLITDPADLEVVHHQFYEGEHVQIIAGPMMGIEGLVVEHKGNRKIAVNIEKLGKSVLVNVPKNNLKKVQSVHIISK